MKGRIHLCAYLMLRGYVKHRIEKMPVASVERYEPMIEQLLKVLVYQNKMFWKKVREG